jgi:NAD(P)-dependent dehydrogenase (short-subunit alcohol dehydrogenase family)
MAADEALNPLDAFRLDGKTAVVAGASSGLGARFAEVLAAAGAQVVLGARREEKLEVLARRIREAGGDATGLRCDVTSEKDVEALISMATDRYGRLDVMVAAAGVAPDEDADPETPKSFRQVLDVNTTGVYMCARAAGRRMVLAGGGSIVNVSSISGLVAGDGRDTPSYAASKGAVVNLTRELAVRWAPSGVRVNSIAPGWFPSEMTQSTLSDVGGQTFVEERTPLGRPGGASELDGALLLLSSDASSYITGHTLVVDGGWTAR